MFRRGSESADCREEVTPVVIRLANQSDVSALAESDGQLIGNLWLQLVEKIPNPRSEPEHHAYITNFYIQEPARRQGTGSRLLKTTLDWCKASHVHVVILWPTDKSRSLYERYGFAVRADLMELVIADAGT